MTAVAAHQPKATASESSERWQRALERANRSGVAVYRLGVNRWAVSSATKPDVAYETDGYACNCYAGQSGDPVCLHRAAVRATWGELPAPAPTQCPECGGTGWVSASIWNWSKGCAQSTSVVRCTCTDHPEPDPAAPGSPSTNDRASAVEAEPTLAERIRLARFDYAIAHSHQYELLGRLTPYNERIERVGRLSEREYQRFLALQDEINQGWDWLDDSRHLLSELIGADATQAYVETLTAARRARARAGQEVAA